MSVTVPDLGPLGDQLLAAVDAPGFAPLALVVALGAGALHACAPGHGKSLTAAYLVGAEGRRRDALALGGVVALMHTLSVILVGLAWMAVSASGALDVTGLTEVLRVGAGVLVLGAGAVLVHRRHRGRRHPHHHHDHVPGNRPGLVLLGMSGGLMPAPAAFLVLLTGIFSDRVGLALVLVVAFGIGMAGVLTSIGLATLGGRSVLARVAPTTGLLKSAAQVGPTLAAWGVLLTGGVLTVVACAALPAA